MPSRFEDDLIPKDEWITFYHQMPKECREAIDLEEDSISIGHHPDVGWFILNGQSLEWSEVLPY